MKLRHLKVLDFRALNFRALNFRALNFRALASDRKLIVIFVVVACIMFIVGKLASEVLEGEAFAIDQRIMLALRLPGNLGQPIGPAWLLPTMRDITAIGGVTGLTLITLLAAGGLIAARNLKTALFILVAVSVGATLASVLKTLFLRPRPTIVPHLVEVSYPSFPSGHAMNSAIVFLTLATLITRTQPLRAVRIYIQAAAISLCLAVGASRVYLGVHWPSDVVAGWCVGGLWAVLCSVIFHGVISNGRPHH